MSQHVGAIVGGRDGHDCIDCKTCGFVHLLKFPNKRELDAFYANEFYQSAKPHYAAEEQEDDAWHAMQYADRWDKAREIADSRGIKIKRVLELGCGTGRFLHYLASREEVEFALGIEPNLRMADPVKTPGVTVLAQPWESLDLTEYGEFNLITAHFVLEHLEAPFNLVDLISKRLLTAGGVFYVGVPNDFTEVQHRAEVQINKPYYWIHYPDHINYFNFGSLDNVLRRAGLEPIFYDSTFPMEGYLLLGLNYVDDPALGRRLHHERVVYELALDAVSRPARRAAQWNQASQGLGRDALIYAVKEKT